MENQEVKHFQVDQKYKVQFERSAVKGVDGFKVEANGDQLALVEAEAVRLYLWAIDGTKPISAEIPVAKEK